MTRFRECWTRRTQCVCLILTLGLLVICDSGNAGGIVTAPTDANLRAALEGGGLVTFATDGTITLTNTLVITNATTIDGTGHGITILGTATTSSNGFRLFYVQPEGSLTLQNLTLTGGIVGRPPGALTGNGGPAFGGAVFVDHGALNLSSCHFWTNFVIGATGASGVNYGTGGDAAGGALYIDGGTLNATNCDFIGNYALGGIGGVYPNGLATNGGSADCGYAMGGALYCSSGKVTLQGVTLATNSAFGGVPQFAQFAVGRGGDGDGGALSFTNSTVFIFNSLLFGNTAGGGGLNAGETSGPGSGAGMGGAVFLSPNSVGNIEFSTLTNNAALGGDTSANIVPGGPGMGGALFSGGQVWIQGCSFSQNLCRGASGSKTEGPGLGGAIYSSNTLVILDSTLQGNAAIGGAQFDLSDAGPGGTAEGGAVWSSGVFNSTNSTWTGNRSAAGQPFTGWAYVAAAEGGAVGITGGTATLVNVTIAGNRADGAVNPDPNFSNGPSLGGGLSNTNGTLSIRNSIVANSIHGGDTWGVITDGGYNICSDGTANFSSTGSLNQTDPMLSALSTNGGPTPTMVPLFGSPARDAVPAGFAPTDQRGVIRPQGPAADIGAVEADFISSSPLISAQPLGGTVRVGTNVTLVVGASGTAPLFYQWHKGSSLISGATASKLVLSNVQAAASGSYFVIVSNSFGTATSQNALLVVDSTPLLLSQPASVVVSLGGTASFSVSADGPSLNYQWWHNGSAFGGATAPTLVISNAIPGSEGSYFAVISNFAGSVTSQVATLSFDSSALSILTPPKDTTARVGYPASFTVVASGLPTLAFQWQHNGNPIAGATTSTLNLSVVGTNDAGLYYVVVSNAYRTVTSSSATLVVTPGPLAPRLIAGKAGNNLTITFQAEAGQTYELLSSTDLVSWSPAGTNSAVSAGQLQFVEPVASGSRMFYKVVTH